MNLRFYVVLFSCLFLGVGARSQEVAIKVIYCMMQRQRTLTRVLSLQWTLDVSGNYNGWTFSGSQVETCSYSRSRYWFCDRFAGHFGRASFRQEIMSES
ncbi:MAG: DUF3575 domain-containing protein [Butyricimonas faecihominis]